MEPYREHILPKLSSGRPKEELDYLNSLFAIASPDSDTIAGPAVVAFFKQSKLEIVGAASNAFTC